MHWKTLLWVTDHFCKKRTFEKNAIFCPKKSFFLTKMAIWPTGPRGPVLMSRNYFLGCNLKPVFEAKKLRKVEEKCPGHFDSSQFSPKWAIFSWFEKFSFQKWLEPCGLSVCNPNTSWYMVSDHIFPENAPILVKNRNFHF